MNEGFKKSSIAFLAGTIVGYKGIGPLMHLIYWALIFTAWYMGSHLWKLQ